MGLHMLVADADRAAYLSNAASALKPGAPMLFYAESYGENSYRGPVFSVEQWAEINQTTFFQLEKRTARSGGIEVEVELPLLPARSKTREGYVTEMNAAGFAVEKFIDLSKIDPEGFGAAIYVRKMG
jgi:hypothetical protein